MSMKKRISYVLIPLLGESMRLVRESFPNTAAAYTPKVLRIW